jgi:hypothetical protein
VPVAKSSLDARALFGKLRPTALGEAHMADTKRIDHADIVAVERLERTVKNLILLFGGAIFAFFGFLELKNAPINRVTEAFDVFSIVKIGLFLFVVGWISGAGDDTDIQREIVLVDRRKAKFDASESLGIAAFFLVFALLFYFRESLVLFQVTLLVFICLNVWTYSKILERVDAETRFSEALYLDEKDRDYFSFMKLYCALGYLHGSWQTKRFKTLIALAALQVVVAILVYTDAYRPYVPDTRIGALTLHVYIEYLPSVLFLVYVIISEAWMKIYRYKIRSDFATIERMRDHFSLQKKKNVELPPLDRSSIWGTKNDDNPNYVSGSLLDMLKWG